MNLRERALIDLFAAMEDISWPVMECKFYPCHFNGQDCSLCYCPFYPCLIYRLGGELINSDGKLVWSCKNCSWVHEKENLEEILAYFSSFPRQLLIESDWRFFSRSLQEILYGEELGYEIGGAYSLMPANFYSLNCEPIAEGEFLDVVLNDFSIVSVRRLRNPDEAQGVLIPEKSGNILVGYLDGFVRCIF